MRALAVTRAAASLSLSCLISLAATGQTAPPPPQSPPPSPVAYIPPPISLGDDRSYPLAMLQDVYVHLNSPSSGTPVGVLPADTAVSGAGAVVQFQTPGGTPQGPRRSLADGPLTTQQIQSLGQAAAQATGALVARPVAIMGVRMSTGRHGSIWTPDLALSLPPSGIDLGVSWLVGSTVRGLGFGLRIPLVGAQSPYTRSLGALKQGLLAARQEAASVLSGGPEAPAPERLQTRLTDVQMRARSAADAYTRSVSRLQVAAVLSQHWFSRGGRLGAVGLTMGRVIPLERSRPCSGVAWSVLMQATTRSGLGAPSARALRLGVSLSWQDQVPTAFVVSNPRDDLWPDRLEARRWTTKAGVEYLAQDPVDGGGLFAVYVRRRDLPTGLEWTLHAGKDAEDRAFVSARVGWAPRY